MTERQCLQQARRVVVKIGSRVLVQPSGRPDIRRMRECVRDLCALKKAGMEVILVTSGAIGAGMQALGMTRRPTSVPDLQMAAAVGQSRLMATYDELFGAADITIGQILLTHDDLNHRTRHLNARNTMLNLLGHGIVPIVNENDVVAIDEIKFGDNDQLASLVAIMMDADYLVLLTTVDGFRIPASPGRTKRASILREVSEETLVHAVGKGSDLSTGGMASKLTSAGMAVSTGIPVVIANGRTNGILQRIANGDDVGTLILPPGLKPDGELPHRKRWIAFFHRTRGAVVLDDGAVNALLTKGRSLLAAGIREVEGTFEKGSVINILGPDRTVIARGLAAYSSANIAIIKGHKSSEITSLLGSCDYEEVVHRDNMVLLGASAMYCKREPAKAGTTNAIIK